MTRALYRLGTVVLAVSLAGAPGCAGRSTDPGRPARRNAAEAPPPFATAPEFTLTDGHGRSHDLGSLMGAKGLVLVLYRGHW